MAKERTTTWVRLVSTGAGRMGLAASEKGLVLSTLPGRVEAREPGAEAGQGRGRYPKGVTRPAGPARRPAPEAEPPAKVAAVLDQAERALVDYYAHWPECPGRRILALWEEVRKLPVDLEGLTTFSRRVLEFLREVPPGVVVTYGELAARAGSPRAARAVGLVMARNPIPVVFPCHRVIASDGTLGGFSGGTREEALAFKESLLRYEGWLTRGGKRNPKW